MPEDGDTSEDADMPDDDGMPEDREMIDVEAIEQFGQALDSLGAAGLADQALTEDVTAGTAMSPTSY
jgi:hypothetical protein